MVSTTFVKDMDLDIDRPKASAAKRSSLKSIRIYVSKDGTTYMDGQPVRIWMLQSRIRDQIKAGASDNILVIIDENVPARTLIEVVDQAKLAGASDVGVATELEVGA